LMVSCGPPAGNRSQIAGAAPLPLVTAVYST
jgi:hypothetical protein